MKTATNSASNRRRSRSALLAIASALAFFAVQSRAAAIVIFPSADALPANHLKFYLHFPEPMRQGVFLDYCRLLDEHGQAVLEPFRETELWSEDRLRLTLWLHPGRQKTGVNLNDEFGPVLAPNCRYTLVISGKWPTERGPALGRDAQKSFRTIERATAQLDLAGWKLTTPKAATREPLEIRFPAPLDHALLHRCLRVRDTASAVVRGSIGTADGERVWRFIPAAEWSAGEYRLQIESVLEDLAGNSLARPFERNLEAPTPKPVENEQSVNFRVQERP